MAKRKICNFRNASDEVTRPDAIFQRGQYWIERKTDRSRDPYKYAIYINDSMLGMVGQFPMAKRFCQEMYVQCPFDKDVCPDMEQVLERLRKKYKIKLRPSLKPNKAKRKTKKRDLKKKSLIGRDLYTEFMNRYQVAADMLLEAQESNKPLKTMYNKPKRLAADAIKEMQANEALFEPLDFLQLISDFQNIIQNVEDDTARLFPTKKKTAPTAAETRDILVRALSCETVEETKKELKKLKAVKKPPKHVIEAIEIIENTRCK